ncbi:hypothetical protein GCM10027037_14790 [Mucilaginibacter koreensis]
MTIQLANTLFSSGALAELHKAGFINDKVFLYREIYLWVQARQQTRHISRNQAVAEAQIQFNRDRRTIWRALHTFADTDAPLAASV